MKKNDGFVLKEVTWVTISDLRREEILSRPYTKIFQSCVYMALDFLFCENLSCRKRIFKLTNKTIYNLEYKEILWHYLPQICTLRLSFCDWWKAFQNSFSLETQIFEDLDGPVAYKCGLTTLVSYQKKSELSIKLIGQV